MPTPRTTHLVLRLVQHEPAGLPGLHEGPLLVEGALIGPASAAEPGPSAPSQAQLSPTLLASPSSKTKAPVPKRPKAGALTREPQKSGEEPPTSEVPWKEEHPAAPQARRWGCSCQALASRGTYSNLTWHPACPHGAHSPVPLLRSHLLGWAMVTGSISQTLSKPLLCPWQLS